MDTQIQVHQFQKKKVRVINLSGKSEPWFLASEIGKAIGVRNISNLIKNLDSDEKLKILPNDHTLRSDIGIHKYVEYWIISESGLYQCLMRSDKPIARDFQRWLRKTVLPELRKTGQYIAPAKQVTVGRPRSAKNDLMPGEKLERSYQAFKAILKEQNIPADRVNELALQLASQNHPDIVMTINRDEIPNADSIDKIITLAKQLHPQQQYKIVSALIDRN